MITVTERAKERLKNALLITVKEPEMGLRLETTSLGECGLYPDRERDGDHVIEHEGTKVLLLSERVSRLLEDATLDTSGPAPQGTKLVIRRSRGRRGRSHR